VSAMSLTDVWWWSDARSDGACHRPGWMARALLDEENGDLLGELTVLVAKGLVVRECRGETLLERGVTGPLGSGTAGRANWVTSTDPVDLGARVGGRGRAASVRRQLPSRRP
jgi:hypothetical protein